MQAWIICPGPNGKDFHSQLWQRAKTGDLIIACNKGILALEYPGNGFARFRYNIVWAVCDPLCTEQDWWTRASDRCISWGIVPMFAEEVWERMRPGLRGGPSFNQGEPLSPQDSALTPHYLRYNATIAGQALQLAVHAGAERIHLVGCDMHGSMYYDGTGYALPRLDWPHVKTLQALIDHIRESIPVEIETPSLLV